MQLFFTLMIFFIDVIIICSISWVVLKCAIMLQKTSGVSICGLITVKMSLLNFVIKVFDMIAKKSINKLFLIEDLFFILFFIVASKLSYTTVLCNLFSLYISSLIILRFKNNQYCLFFGLT